MSKMIIAEDENLIIDYLYRCIDTEALGITEIFKCSNGEVALNLIKNNDIDIVLTDINMPKMDGLELIKRTKLLYSNVKFIIISGYDDFHLVKEAFKLGVCDYILKSELVVDELTKIIKSVLGRNIESELSTPDQNASVLKETRLKELIWSAKNLNDNDISYNFRLDMKDYCVVVFKILNFEEILKNHWDGDSELLKYGLSNLINEILAEFNFGEAISGYNDEIVFIFSLSDADTKNKILQITNKIQNHISLYFNFKFRIGISAEKGKAPKILYQEAQEASNYCFFDNCYLKDYESISKNFPFSFSDTGKLLKSFEKYILTFNFKAITDNFEKFVFHSAPLSFIDDVLELYREYFKIISIVIMQHQWISNMKLRHEEIIQMGTLSELNHYLFEIIENLRKIFSNETDPVKKIKKYVDENYHRNISPDNLAMMFCIDQRKLVREFSKTYGMTLSKYITDVRMKRAMQLITTSNFLLREISEMVGYVNYESFSRVFYNYWGQWPKKVKSKD